MIFVVFYVKMVLQSTFARTKIDGFDFPPAGLDFCPEGCLERNACGLDFPPDGLDFHQSNASGVGPSGVGLFVRY